MSKRRDERSNGQQMDMIAKAMRVLKFRVEATALAVLGRQYRRTASTNVLATCN